MCPAEPGGPPRPCYRGLIPTAFAIDPQQGLSRQDELDLVRLAADLGYASAWTPAGPDAAAFDRCIRWHAASGLPVGISAVPASGQPPAFYAEHARRVWEATGGRFTLVVGSGAMQHAADGMQVYLRELRPLLPSGAPLYIAALGPLMLDLAGRVADGVGLNWCTPGQVAWSRERVAASSAADGRPMPAIVEYIRTAVDPEPEIARRTLGNAVRFYALGPLAYRRHFERMGFGDELRRVDQAANGTPAADPTRMGNETQATNGAPPPADWDPAFLSAVGAWGRPGDVRARVERLAEGLDLAIVRVLVPARGDAASARRVLEECAPNRAG